MKYIFYLKESKRPDGKNHYWIIENLTFDDSGLWFETTFGRDLKARRTFVPYESISFFREADEARTSGEED